MCELFFFYVHVLVLTTAICILHFLPHYFSLDAVRFNWEHAVPPEWCTISLNFSPRVNLCTMLSAYRGANDLQSKGLTTTISDSWFGLPSLWCQDQTDNFVFLFKSQRSFFELAPGHCQVGIPQLQADRLRAGRDFIFTQYQENDSWLGTLKKEMDYNTNRVQEVTHQDVLKCFGYRWFGWFCNHLPNV